MSAGKVCIHYITATESLPALTCAGTVYCGLSLLTVPLVRNMASALGPDHAQLIMLIGTQCPS